MSAFDVGENAVDVLSNESPARVVGILGMHRSGTSCLTGSLQEAGLFLGECHTWNPHNLKGNRENQKFVDFHDSLLEVNGGAWDLPPVSVTWSDENVAVATALLTENGSESVFGFKDPRTLLVIDGWKKLVPSIEFVGIFRHPNAVARSLEKRSAKAWDESVKLWYAYNNVLYQEYKKKPFPILNFDDSEAVLDEKILQVADDMGFAAAAPEEKFYSPELKSSVDKDSPSLPWKVRRLYKKLKKIGL
jgi:hypothetical protein